MEQPLLPVNDIPEDGTVVVDFFGREVHVYLVDGRPTASANVCSHLGGPLERCGGEFVCSWHGATFDASTGDQLAGPGRRGSRMMHLPTKIVDEVLTYVWSD